MPHPSDLIEDCLRAAGRELATVADSVSVQVRATDPPTAVLEFEMFREAQYKVVDRISRVAKRHTFEFYEDSTIRFPKG